MASSETTAGALEPLDPRQIEEYRGYLLGYALLQLRDATAAEDAVQETLLAALQSTSFAGRSSLKTWRILRRSCLLSTHCRCIGKRRSVLMQELAPGTGVRPEIFWPQAAIRRLPSTRIVEP